MIEIKNYINGKLFTSANKNYLKIFNPSIGKIYAKCPNSSKDDLEKAIKSAELSFPGWSSLTQSNRSKFLFKKLTGKI